MKRIAEIVAHPFSCGSTLDVAVDVSMDDLHFETEIRGERVTRSIANRTIDIRLLLGSLRGRAKIAGYQQLRVVAESTGCYHELLLRIAASMKMETVLVDTMAVKNMRKILHGDAGKSDKRDPGVIHELASRDHVVKHRRLPEIYQLMRRFHLLYNEAEVGVVDAKCRIHRCLKALFPDLDFCAGYQYTNSGRAIMKAYGFNPHAIVRSGLKRLHSRLKKLVPRIRSSSIERLLRYAQASVSSTPSGRLNDVRVLELRLAWEDFLLHEGRKDEARKVLEALYDEALELDPRLPRPAKGFASKVNLARVLAETGPLTDFASWRQLIKMAGLNLCERQSGKFKGKIKISKAGRHLLRKVLVQMALPLVKKKALYGPYYHHKISVEKAIGGVAMTAVARKLLKLIWGLYRSGGLFSANRVFACESQLELAA